MSKLISFATGGVLVATGMWYYDDKNSIIRYSVEQEYAFISTCVGYYGNEKRKNNCVNFLKQCQEKRKKNIDSCVNYINELYSTN
ncbi:hypothetical protein [Campylobacter helveticus]|uniref:hypothetical protein n=1 Tax=Campylobacter helveticus TaxID=28898 RepID=UPI0011123165|nr:hypothetical protein [Campylobacter helveticus]MCR2056264.1 hypothetical protein [Campylobacter helveticus]MCR2065427.1 hypothetical protein [Campylobacter helveticus]TNB64288.1 hypothetical protein FDW43_02610 [Campylobacter helveticus]TNH33740.1 hypothetical protein FDW46_05835 [Campylobacter helveticus]TNH36201.1 hypothetical protein FDW45_06525 [Campylobacter helveticus]